MTAPSELTGQYGGFVFTDAGKRRMLLRHDGHDWLLKVPRLLRRRIIGKFRAGESISVAVTEEKEWETGVSKQVVSRVLPAAASPADRVSPLVSAASAAPCVVSVCSKKNCWRKGGRELWEALGREVEAGGHAGRVELRQVGCLDRCKQAPNADCGRRAYAHCSPGSAGAILMQNVGRLSLCEIEK